MLCKTCDLFSFSFSLLASKEQQQQQKRIIIQDKQVQYRSLRCPILILYGYIRIVTMKLLPDRSKKHKK